MVSGNFLSAKILFYFYLQKRQSFTSRLDNRIRPPLVKTYSLEKINNPRCSHVGLKWKQQARKTMLTSLLCPAIWTSESWPKNKIKNWLNFKTVFIALDLLKNMYLLYYCVFDHISLGGKSYTLELHWIFWGTKEHAKLFWSCVCACLQSSPSDYHD